METAPHPPRWFQFRLSSLLAAQLVAAGLVYLNFTREVTIFTDRAESISMRIWGYPFLWLGKEYTTGEFGIEWPPFGANVLLWATLIFSTLFGLELFHRIRKFGWKRNFAWWWRPHVATLILALVLATATVGAQFKREASFAYTGEPHMISLGWPWSEIRVYDAWEGASLTVEGWEKFVLNFYTCAALVLIPTILCETWLRRRERKKIEPSQPPVP